MKTIRDFAENFRNLNTGSGSTAKEVVWDNVTGTFVEVPAGTHIGSGEDVITSPDVKGFGSGEEPNPLPSKDRNWNWQEGGIFETDALKDKTAAIIGCGGLGSQVAEQLARNGIGRLVLVDFDVFKARNISRHVAGVSDLGRKKTDICEDIVRNINPYIEVEKYDVNICDHPQVLKEIVAKANIILACTDNNSSRFRVGSQLAESGKPGLFGRVLKRGQGIDCFLYRPGDACYGCLFGNNVIMEEEIRDAQAGLESGQIPAYASPEDIDILVQPGLPDDMLPLVYIMTKWAMLQIVDAEKYGLAGLKAAFGDTNYILFANRQEGQFQRWGTLAAPGTGPAIGRYYAMKITKNPDCMICMNDHENTE